jgi:hypothetical protein
MSCPVKKSLNLRICGFGMPRQAFDIELKCLFKVKSGWSVKKIGEEEFPSEELRNELTRFKGSEFAIVVIKAKLEATDLDKH